MPPPTHARRLLIAMLVVAIALTAVLVWPFWVAFFLASVISATLRSSMEWLARKLGGRREPAAAILTIGVLLAVVLPLALMGTLLVREVFDGITWVRELFASEGIGGILGRLPGPLEDAARKLLEVAPEPQQQIQQIAQQGQQAAGAVATLIAATGSVVFQTVMMLISLFFLLVDGSRLVGWLDRHVPLRPGLLRELIEEFRKTSISVLTSTLATAGIQTLTALVGYLIARAPNVIFFTLGTFVVALVPALGGTVMVVTVGLVLLATGHVLGGVFLIAWGAAVVSLIDNVARPYLLKGGMELHGGVVFFALLGGLAIFGGIGLVLGPLIVTFLLAVLKMYEREYGRGVTPESSAPPGAEQAARIAAPDR
jgi:predicted PurR-regulated permease PerM